MSRLSILLAGVALSLVLLCAAVPAQAWTPIDSSRPTWCSTVPYSMNSAGSADLGVATSEMLVQDGMDDWTRVSCTSLNTTYNGRVSNTPGSYEGTSTIGWVESGWRHGSGAIGVTGPRWGRSCIIEADMELNGVNYTWITGSGSGGSVNAYSIILHEGGHYYGLGHSSDSNATMYYAYRGGISSLNSDDEAGICALYPGEGGSDCTTTGCPSGQECVDGSCRTVTGDGTVCSPCSSGSDCGGSSDLCLRYPDGAGYCGKACSSSADCGSSEECVGISGGSNQCVRMNSSGSPDCSSAPPPGCSTDSDCESTHRCNTSTGECELRATDRGELGEPCTQDSECNSGTCFFTPSGGVCTSSCDWLDPADCPSGFYCDGDATGACGSGVCLAGSAGAAAMGETCSADTDCASLFCSLGTCASPCIPDGTTGCPDGYSCQIGTTSACGACKMAGDTGDPCGMNEDCGSRICAVAGDRTFCTELCMDASGCPDGFTCEPAGDTSVCVPPVGGGDGGAGAGGRDRDGGCGCVAAGADPEPDLLGWVLGLLLLIPLARRRLRRR